MIWMVLERADDLDVLERAHYLYGSRKGTLSVWFYKGLIIWMVLERTHYWEGSRKGTLSGRFWKRYLVMAPRGYSTLDH